jgi:tRNA-specific 2-thiouridylase
MIKRVVVGLSGGVDSSVAAHLLLQKGYEVVGIFMRNWHDESVTINNECPWIDDSNDAMLVAESLGIPFHVLDMSAQYKDRIVDYMFREYEAGRTPNPDILCNREIKFDLFLEAALNLKADFVATGHYCRKESFKDSTGKEVHRLLAGVDINKDQSYFLCQLSQNQLSKALFPIGHLTKPQVREIAANIHLPNAEKKDSQGLCFIGKVKLPTFLQQQLSVKKGKIVEVPDSENLFPSRELASTDEIALSAYAKGFSMKLSDGVVIGEHNGAHFFTIGQRKGLGVGGKAIPLFIVETNTTENTVYVGQGENHRALLRKCLFIEENDIHWIRQDRAMNSGDEVKLQVRIRYRQPLCTCMLYRRSSGLYLVFDEFQRGIARGQFAAWYDGDELLGSGVIS